MMRNTSTWVSTVSTTLGCLFIAKYEILMPFFSSISAYLTPYPSPILSNGMNLTGLQSNCLTLQMWTMKKSQIQITLLWSFLQNQLKLCVRYSVKLDTVDWFVGLLSTTFSYLNTLNTSELLTIYLVIFHWNNQWLGDP